MVMPNRPDAKAENIVRSTAEVSAEILGDGPWMRSQSTEPRGMVS